MDTTAHQYPARTNSPLAARHRSVPVNDPTQNPPSSSNTTVSDEDSPMTGIEHAGKVMLGVVPDEGYVTESGQHRERSGSSFTPTDSLETVGARVKQLMDAMNEIARCGVPSVDISIPMTVVVGDQSVGKSSLIEGISGVKVPRDTGTCTRCVLQITTKESDQQDGAWSCTIYLRKHFDLYDAPLINPITGKPEPFGPWGPKDQPESTHFASSSDPNDMERLLRAAQLATLTPSSVNPVAFAELPISRLEQIEANVEFSPNVVSVEVTGPKLPNLSFYDLPGVISQTVNSENNYLVKLVKAVVKSYVQNPHALILLACSMENDLENSTAASLVRKAGAEDRCIGVLTKPDRLAAGASIEMWHEVFSGRRFALRHGYYVTRQPSQAELKMNMSHQSAKNVEHSFFLEEPWVNHFAQYQERFGSWSLQAALSVKLAEQICSSLPELRRNVRSKLEQIGIQLNNLPDPPSSNAVQIVHESINTFVTRMTQVINGDHFANQLKLAYRDIKGSFKKAVTEMRPTLTLPKVSNEQAVPIKRMKPLKETPTKRSGFAVDAISLVDSDGDSPAPTASETPSKKRKMDGSASTPVANGLATPTRPKNPLAKSFKLEEIRQILDDYSESGLPGEVDSKAVDQLILQCFVNWGKALDKMLADLKHAMMQSGVNAFHQTIGKWENTELYQLGWTVVNDFLNDAFTTQTNAAQRALRLERFKPLTENGEIDQHRRQALEDLMNNRFRQRFNQRLEDRFAELGKPLNAQEQVNVRQELGPDPYQREVEVMAKIRAYYCIASTRFIDNICASVQGELFENVKTGLWEQLIDGLGVSAADPKAHENCVALLAEDAARERKRVMCQKEKVALEKAQECLDKLVQRG